MGRFRKIVGKFSSRARAEEAIQKYEETYEEVKRTHPELDPHDHLAQVWISRMSATGRHTRNLDMQKVAYRVTKQFACVPPPECVRAMAMHMVNIEDQESFLASSQLQKEFVVLMTPVSLAKENGTMHELYARYNPNRAAENAAKIQYSGNLESDEDGHHDPAITEDGKDIEFDPNDATAYFNRGYEYKEQGKKAEAIADFEKFITLTDNPVRIKIVQGWIEELSE